MKQLAQAMSCFAPREKIPEFDAEADAASPKTPKTPDTPESGGRKGRSKGKAASKNCAMCHGQNLEGRDAVPGIAGRSPSYLARQLHDFQTGARHGPLAAMMKPSVAKMTATDIVNITAYLASLPVKP
jgi:cytochrome c553